MRAERGEIWPIDFGSAAKVRPALLLTGEPADDQLDLFTVLLHTTALRGHRWELGIPKPFLQPGAFHLQQVQTISGAKLMRRLGALTPAEMQKVDDALRLRLGLYFLPPVMAHFPTVRESMVESAPSVVSGSGALRVHAPPHGL